MNSRLKYLSSTNLTSISKNEFRSSAKGGKGAKGKKGKTKDDMSVKSEKVTRSKSGKYFFHGLSILSSNLEMTL